MILFRCYDVVNWLGAPCICCYGRNLQPIFHISSLKWPICTFRSQCPVALGMATGDYVHCILQQSVVRYCSCYAQRCVYTVFIYTARYRTYLTFPLLLLWRYFVLVYDAVYSGAYVPSLLLVVPYTCLVPVSTVPFPHAGFPLTLKKEAASLSETSLSFIRLHASRICRQQFSLCQWFCNFKFTFL